MLTRLAALPKLARCATRLVRPLASVLPAQARVATARAMSTASAATAAKPDMFCYQCEQTKDVKGCTTVGVCGKTPDVAALQDVLVYCLKGISMYATRARAINEKYRSNRLDRFFIEAYFATLTNVNFDAARLTEYIQMAHRMRDRAKALYEKACKEEKRTVEDLSASEYATFNFTGDTAALVKAAEPLGIWQRKQTLGDDIVGLQELITYGLKGACAYADHAVALGVEREAVYSDLYKLTNKLTEKPTVDGLLATALAVGQANFRIMDLLDGAHVTRFGHPTPAKVRCHPVPGKCIVVSGHDMPDLEAILKQTEGKGINVYTHGEMLPAHGYAALRKYKHLVGHWGGPWNLQKVEFAEFPGAILMTTNCLIEPRKSYADRIFTRHSVGFKGIRHLDSMDFTEVVEAALKAPGFTEEDCKAFKPKYFNVGFARKTILDNAGAIINLVKQGKVQRFFFIGGCDGNESERSYFRDLALAMPKDCFILTAGCGKYRVNGLPLGDIAGFPRVLDCGQCNDSYSAIQVAVALTKAFGLKSVNELPLSFAVSWFEQKAVAVLLTLLYLGVQKIRLGPNLPAFATPAMLQILGEKFKLMPINAKDVKGDLAKMMKGQ